MVLPDDPSLVIVTDDDPRLRQEHKALASGDFLNGATGGGDITRSGPLVEFYLEWEAPSWTNGDVLIVLPTWACPTRTRYLPPFYANKNGQLVAFAGGNVQGYNLSGGVSRLSTTWRTDAV